MCLDVRNIESPVSLTQNQVTNHITRTAIKPIICYKKLQPYGVDSSIKTSRAGGYKWHKKAVNNAEFTYSNFRVKKVSQPHECSKHLINVSVEAGLHAYVNPDECRKSSYSGSTMKMIIPVGAKYILGVQGSERQIVATAMIYDSIYRKPVGKKKKK